MGTHPIFESDFDCLTDKMLFEFCLIALASGQMFKKVKLKDVDVLTLYQGKMTNGRRSSPVPQLSCRGGTAGCGAFVPEMVQCYNRGSDGLDVQWECKTDMDNKYRFGKISVSCEGYDYPDDPYILAGSCGLDYTIDRVGNSGNFGNSKSYSSYQAPKSTSTESEGEINWVFIAIVCIICWAMWKNLTENDNNQGNGIPPAGTEPSAPPPYPETGVPPAGSSFGQNSHQNTGRQGWRPGFFSGFGTGWFSNQWWNSGNRGYTGYQRWSGHNHPYNTRYRSSNQSAYNQGYADGAGDSSPPRSRKTSSGSSGTRTASGFGGTTRR